MSLSKVIIGFIFLILGIVFFTYNTKIAEKHLNWGANLIKNTFRFRKSNLKKYLWMFKLYILVGSILFMVAGIILIIKYFQG
ncbi:MAG: hypothetical protein KKD48_02165 [Nanoarchaeota archaeon]|nr:hypothetical protein [Nanoarchaeota archaeon]